MGRLFASGVVALLLPPFLARALPLESYSTWVLVLQVATYFGLLDLGIQTAVARFVAHAGELNDPEQRDGIASTAFLILLLAAVLGLVVLGLLTWRLAHLFPSMPLLLQGEAKTALLILGGSFLIGLPVSVIHAVFIGQQRNKIPISIFVANRLVSAALIVMAVLWHAGIAAMAGAVAIANILSYCAAFLAWRKWAPDVSLRFALASKVYARQIAGYSAGLGVWYAGMMLVSGLDLGIVGIFDYHAAAYYAVAVTLTNLVIQTQNAICAALLPASAVLNARGDSVRLGTLLVSSTRYGMLILLVMALPLLIAGKLVLRIWVGPEFASHSTAIMQILVIANVIRLSFLPYATLLLGIGEHRKVILSPIAEGITNLLASVVGASMFGAIGVAIGTLIGSFVSSGMHLLHNMPRTTAIAIDRSLLLKEGLFRPLICAVPFVLLMLFRILMPTMQAQTVSVLLGIAIIGSLYLLWNFGLISPERQKLDDALFHA